MGSTPTRGTYPLVPVNGNRAHTRRGNVWEMRIETVRADFVGDTVTRAIANTSGSSAQLPGDPTSQAPAVSAPGDPIPSEGCEVAGGANFYERREPDGTWKTIQVNGNEFDVSPRSRNSKRPIGEAFLWWLIEARRRYAGRKMPEELTGVARTRGALALFAMAQSVAKVDDHGVHVRECSGGWLNPLTHELTSYCYTQFVTPAARASAIVDALRLWDEVETCTACQDQNTPAERRRNPNACKVEHDNPGSLLREDLTELLENLFRPYCPGRKLTAKEIMQSPETWITKLSEVVP